MIEHRNLLFFFFVVFVRVMMAAAMKDEVAAEYNLLVVYFLSDFCEHCGDAYFKLS